MTTSSSFDRARRRRRTTSPTWRGSVPRAEAATSWSTSRRRSASGSTLADIDDYAPHNDLGTAVVLRARRARRASRGSSSRRRWWSTARARTAAREHGRSRPPPRTADDLDAGRFEPALPALRRRPRCPAWSAEDAPLDPRNVYAATKVHGEHLGAVVGAGDRRHGRRAALPQRLRPGDAARTPRTPASPRCSVRSCDRGEPPQVFEDGAAAPRLRPRRRRRRGRRSPPPARPSGRRHARSTSARAAVTTIGEMAAALPDRSAGPTR